MNFKYDKGVAAIVAVGCLCMAAWAVYLPKYQKKQAAERQKMLLETRRSSSVPQTVSPSPSPALQGTHSQPPADVSGSAPSPSGNTIPVSSLPEHRFFSLENALFRVQIDAITGSVTGAELLGERYKRNDEDKAIELFRNGAVQTFSIRSSPLLQPVSVETKSLSDSSTEVVRTFTNGISLTQTFTILEDNYLIRCRYSFTNPTSSPVTIDSFGIGLAGLPPVKNMTGDHVYSERLNVDFCRSDRNICESVDPQIKSQEKFLQKTTSLSRTSWIGSTNKYFASMLFTSDGQPFLSASGDRIWLFPEGSVNEKERYAIPSMIGEFGSFTISPNAQEPVNFQLFSYLGPKEMGRIRALHPSAMGVMHISYYSWFEFIARPMVQLLNWLKGLFGSYGLAIIMLTVIVRVLFWPVTQKANNSMRRMQKIQPKIKELQEKYKADPLDSADDTARKKTEMNQKMMELYRIEKVNPLGGCLPIFLQIPVFIALYSALDSAVELRHVSFLWCTDLSRPDLIGPTLPFALPFFGKVGFHPLVISMTVLMVLQQKMTPSAMDPTQKKMMMIMPIMMLFMFYNLPSGLTLYWTISQIFSILQMKYGQIAVKREENNQNKKPKTA